MRVNQWEWWQRRSLRVLPLVSVFDPASDSLTIALQPDSNIPHLQVEWKDTRTLRITPWGTAAGLGGGKCVRPFRSTVFATHAADYRSVLAAYAGRYPAYFEAQMSSVAFREGELFFGIITSRSVRISRK